MRHVLLLLFLLAGLGCASGERAPESARSPVAEGASAAASPASQGSGMCEAPDPGCAIPPEVEPEAGARNVLGSALGVCSNAPLTGFRRSGRCETGAADRGVHVVCAEMTDAFLEFTAGRGNDLSTPRPEFRFPGLRAGDRWCLCASRWVEAEERGVAPPVVLTATDEAALRYAERGVYEANALPSAE